jgi:hypothetical protein
MKTPCLSPGPENSLPVKITLTFSCCFLCCLTLFFYLSYGLPLQFSLLWFLGVLLAFYVPGRVLLKSVGLVKDNFFSNIILSVGTGISVIPVVYLYVRRIAQPELILAVLFIFTLVWIFSAFRDYQEKKYLNISASAEDLFIITAVTLFIVFALHLSHFTDIVYIENGFKLRQSHLTETVFHLGLINSLVDVFPPPAIYASGEAGFSYYHLNMHLAIELINRFLFIDSLPLTYFYFPFLFFALLAFLPFVYFNEFWGYKFLGAFCGLLMFGSDLSFLPGIFSGTTAGSP